MRKTGVIDWYVHEKGFGFIKTDDGEMIIVHHKDVERKYEREFEDGLSVSFEVFQDRAVNVKTA